MLVFGYCGTCTQTKSTSSPYRLKSNLYNNEQHEDWFYEVLVFFSLLRFCVEHENDHASSYLSKSFQVPCNWNMFIYFHLAGNVFYPIRRRMSWLKKNYIYGINNKNESLEKNVKPLKAYSWRTKRSFICCLNNPENNQFLPSETELLNGKVIYSVAAAMGHNKVCRVIDYMFSSCRTSI